MVTIIIEEVVVEPCFPGGLGEVLMGGWWAAQSETGVGRRKVRKVEAEAPRNFAVDVLIVAKRLLTMIVVFGLSLGRQSREQVGRQSCRLVKGIWQNGPMSSDQRLTNFICVSRE